MGSSFRNKRLAGNIFGEPTFISMTDEVIEIAEQIEEKIDGAVDIFDSDGIKSTIKHCIPSGVYNLDQILARDINGQWGLPEGRIIEVFGDEATSKTSFCLSCVKSIISAGGYGIYFDPEFALDPAYVKNHGIKKMMVFQPDFLEKMLEQMDDCLEILKAHRENGFDKPVVMVVDSVAGTPCKAELDGDYEVDAYGGPAARTWSKAMRKISNKVSDSRVILILINQKRDKVGASQFEIKYITYGGRAIRFYSSIRIELKRVGGEKEGEGKSTVHSADVVEAYTVKNKLSPRYRKARFVVRYGRGINSVDSLLRACEMRNLVTKSGAWYALEDKKFQKKDFITLLKETKGLKKKLLEGLRDEIS